jgi:glucose-1-phosphate thymidylyltransferase
MKGVILAAGKGSRLYPITHHIPKPILPLANRPTMEYAFDRLKEIGVTEICIVVGENEGAMKEFLKDGSQYGVQLSYVRQTEPKGLAHAVGFAEEWVGGDDFALYLGDALYGKGFQDLLQKFKDTKCANLNLVKHVEDPSRFGVAYVGENDRIYKLVEKPKEWTSNWCMAGFYLFGPQIWKVLPDLKPSARGEYEITDAIQMLCDRGESVVAGYYDGDWFDSGTLDSFLEVSHYVAKGANILNGNLECEVGENVIIGEGATLKCTRIDDAVILPGASVITDGAIRHCLIGGKTTRHGDLVGLRIYGDETLEG